MQSLVAIPRRLALLAITLVIRGDDLLPSTGRQIQLARLIGRFDPPAFLHHPVQTKQR